MNILDTSNIDRLQGIISSAGIISVAVHIHPDGDALGSGIAMITYLQSLGKDAVLILPHVYPDSLEFLVTEDLSDHIMIYADEPEKAAARIMESDAIFCQDFNDFSRTGDMAGLLESSSAEKVLIDHHLNPSAEKFSLVFSETEISSTSELLYWILMKMPRTGGDAKRLPAATATALMTGMTTDTNNFANSTYPGTLQMASDLTEAGVDREMIIGNVFNSFRENRIRLMGKMLQEMTTTNDGVAYMILDRKTIMEYGIQDGDTEGFVTIPLSIKKIRMSIFMKEDKDRFRVSIRSKKGVSANICAKRYFNGGGHELASGGRMMIPSELENAEDAARYIEKVTHEYFNGIAND
ncbi:MAG: DHH family phosphoesterase [Clostridium sp.]|nr:DHH family phosphoesterase [Bacteroides sp.]MCM1197881.1 DHH family phosphoesterase [Clostridium sp.]